MFDNIGIDLDQEAGRRRSVSTLLTGLLAAAVSGAIAGLGAWQVTRPDNPGTELAVVFAEPPEAVIDQAPPSLPARRPSAGGGDPRPEPQEPPDEVQELRPQVEERIADRQEAPGVGRGDGEGKGDRLGPGGSAGPGHGDGAGLRVLHHSELVVKRRVLPDYPSAAKAMGLGDQRCLARVVIDARGAPESVEVTDCPRVFHEQTRAALTRWRFEPPRDGERTLRASTTVAIVYRVR